jgi:undecaprenyl-diphosphatase
MLHFRPPAGGVLALIHWSAFPSDHATLFFSLAAGLLLVSRPVGWFAIAWVTLFICLPLLYLGAHWSTDILAGAVLGVSFTQMARIPAIREFVRRMATKWHHKHPILFLAGLILWCYETAVLFEDVRRLLVSVAHFI